MMDKNNLEDQIEMVAILGILLFLALGAIIAALLFSS